VFSSKVGLISVRVVLASLTEDEVTADQYALTLIAFREEGKQYLHLVTVLLEIADVIEDDDGIATEATQFFFQA
jgi:hypothetical protein